MLPVGREPRLDTKSQMVAPIVVSGACRELVANLVDSRRLVLVRGSVVAPACDIGVWTPLSEPPNCIWEYRYCVTHRPILYRDATFDLGRSSYPVVFQSSPRITLPAWSVQPTSLHPRQVYSNQTIAPLGFQGKSETRGGPSYRATGKVQCPTFTLFGVHVLLPIHTLMTSVLQSHHVR